MKSKTLFSIIGAFLLCMFMISSTHAIQEPAPDFENSSENVIIEEQILYQEYEIKVASATPMSGRTNFLEPGYYIMIDRERAHGNLPDCGYVVASTGQNIFFDDELYDYKYRRARGDDYWLISFKVPGHHGEVFNFNIKVFENRNCNVNINSLQRNSIAYEGNFHRLSHGMNSLSLKDNYIPYTEQ